jgi:hypothetical protein
VAKKRISHAWVIPTIVVLVVGFWIANLFVLRNMPDRGTWGDMFGGVNALFSGLAFAFIVYAIFLQHDDLSLTRQEMQEQRFDNIFFQLLRLHNDIIKGIDVQGKDGSKTVDGRDAFRTFRSRLKTVWGSNKASAINTEHDRIMYSYEDVFKSWEADLSHYFRFVYNILQYIHREKQQNPTIDYLPYVKFLRAQLSADELVLLFYNGISEYGRDKFKPLAEEYALFKNLNHSRLLAEKHISYYHHKAFGIAKID